MDIFLYKTATVDELKLQRLIVYVYTSTWDNGGHVHDW